MLEKKSSDQGVNPESVETGSQLAAEPIIDILSLQVNRSPKFSRKLQREIHMPDIKTKKTFGGCIAEHSSPRLDSYNRATTAGARSCVNLCVYGSGQVRILEGKLPAERRSAKAASRRNSRGE
jgi:hypothetical protein